MAPSYSSLPQDEEEKNLLDKPQADERSDPAYEWKDNSLNRLIRWSIIIIVACSILDVFALLYLASRGAFKRPVAVDDLPSRSTYINLEQLYMKNSYQSSAHKPIVNLPKALMLINSSSPDTVYPQYPNSWTTPHGVVPINDRRLLVTPTVTAIAQFRVMDFGMEKCSVTLTIPYNNDTSTPSGSWEARSEIENKLHVWSLKQDSNRKLDLRSLSWKRKPQRDRHLGSFSPTQGTTQELPSFPCKSGDYISFEFACISPDCYFDVTATAKTAKGVYLTQYQTI